MSSLPKTNSPVHLPPRFEERIWGALDLSPWFPETRGRIGEVWFQEPDSTVLIKFLFATEALSVQVHPDDALAQQCGHRRGKTEMWHVLKAEPAAEIALGFSRPVTEDEVRRSAMDGSIMGLLRWIPVKPGETWFIPAGAVHAIGAGITVCEVQQNSDVTYRLFDYGRGRDLHLEESIRALDLGFHAEAALSQGATLVDCAYFEVQQLNVSLAATAVTCVHANAAIALEGSGTIGGVPFTQGDVLKLDPAQTVSLTGNARLLTVITRTSAE